MSFLNYHHLRYFRFIAQEGNLTRAAKNLNISPSALSIQLSQFEESLGLALFERRHKQLLLTEAGRLALDYAEIIFRTGEELHDVLKHGMPSLRQVLRIGAVPTLSRNFQLELVRPLLKNNSLEIIFRTASLSDLLNMLENHAIDVALSNMPGPTETRIGFQSYLIDRQKVILVGHERPKKFRFPTSLDGACMVLPSSESNIRESFDTMMSEQNIRPVIVAEVSDMAMLRLLAREMNAITLLPRVVVQDELKNRTLVELHSIDQIQENFYAITPSRKFPNPLVSDILHSRKRKSR
ncbi:MAG: LysR family transcriptional regulator [Chthoniobacterales bacterium]